MQQQELLWRLQEVDLSVRELENRLEDSPLIRESNSLQEKVGECKASLENTGEELEQKRKNIKSLEMKLQKASQESSDLRRQMYGGEVSSTRELEQMEKKLKLLEKDKGELENGIIEEMEQVEEIENRKKQQEKELEEEEKKLQEVKEKLESEQEEVKKQLNHLQGKRSELAEQVKPEFMEKYETYRQRFNGRGIARVERDICDGCLVFISSALKGRLYKVDKLVYCENCGRILVRLPEES